MAVLVSNRTRRPAAGIASLRLAGTVWAEAGQGRPLRFFCVPSGVGRDSGERIEGGGEEETAFTLLRPNPGDLLLLLVSLYSSASSFYHQAMAGQGGHCSDVVTVREPPPPVPGPMDDAASAAPDLSKGLPELAMEALGRLARCGWEVAVEAKPSARIIQSE